MSFVYITEHGCTLGVDGGLLIIRHTDGSEEFIPKELVEGISIFGRSNMTNSCMKYCLENDIKVGFFNASGKYYGALNPVPSLSLERVKKQLQCTENEKFSLEMAKKLIRAKVNNQLVVAKRYVRGKEISVKEELFPIRNARRKIPYVETKSILLGYEGSSSRCYFSVLGKIINPDFLYIKRTRRPATDPFNAMLNVGYSLLLKEICGQLENRGLLCCAGFLHTGHDKIPALACDMMEEWRSVIVDAAVLSLIQGNEVDISMFECTESSCRLNKMAMKKLLAKLEKKMYTESQYLSYISSPMTFRQALWHQANRMAKAIEAQNVDLYCPVILR